MGRRRMSRTLPDELVERIVAMVPFPYIFKFRVLSKAWLARLSPVSSQEGDQDEKQLAISFQKGMRDSSTKWQTFSPAFVGKKDLIAYNRASQLWRTIPTISFIPKNQLKRSHMRIQAVKGALMLITTGPNNWYVANIVNRRWKHLPPAPTTKDRHYLGTLVREGDAYKVILLLTNGGYLFGQIYDSQLGTWSSKRTDIPGDLLFGCYQDPGAEPIWINGVLYWLVFSFRHVVWGLLAFNVKQETSQVTYLDGLLPSVHLFEVLLPGRYRTPCELVACNGSLLLALYNYARKVTLLKMDLVSGRWLEVTRGPPDALALSHTLEQASSDGKSIYFRDVVFKGILAYDVHKDEWSSFPAPDKIFTPSGRVSKQYKNYFTFEPGLDLFVAL